MSLPKTKDEGLAFFLSLPPSTIRLGLDRVERALAALEHPEARYLSVHVAGTNGKGSTCAFSEAMLRAQGLRTGLYTSPHLERVNERIRVGGEAISDEALGQAVLDVLARHPAAAEELTYFEFGTVLAFWHFAKVGVDVAVLETGLGGRLDATNLCRPSACAISQIAFDHMELLGDTLGKIAFEKAGIFKPGVPAVSCEQNDEAREVLVRRAVEVGSPLWLEGRDYTARLAGGTLCFEGPGLRLSGLALGLRGPHQRQNAGLAIALMRASGIALEERAIREGLAKTRWPGRFELIPGEPPLVLDGAHNPAGVESLLASLDAELPGRPVHLVFAVLRDKEYPKMIARLFPRCASADVAPLESPRTTEPASYLEQARRLCETEPHASVAEALARAQARARSDGGVVLCAGSLFLVGAIRALVAR